jgi:hypothetical protein
VLQKFFDNLNNEGEQDAYDYHGGNGKVKLEVFPFHPYVARQPAQPAKFVVKEINDNPDYHDYNARYYYISACLHVVKKAIGRNYKQFKYAKYFSK